VPTPKPNRWSACFLPDDYVRKIKRALEEVEARVAAVTPYEPDPDFTPAADDKPA